MDKPKRKNDEPSRWDRFLDIVLLAKPFVWEVDLSPEECVEKLRALQKAPAGFPLPGGQAVKINQIYGGYNGEGFSASSTQLILLAIAQ